MNNIDLNKHISCTSSSFVRQICQYLFDNLKVEHFNYVRQFIDGSEFNLTTDPEWTKLFIKDKLYEKLVIDKPHVGNKNLINQVKIIPWNLYPHSQVLNCQKEFSGICAGITICFVYEGFTDFFHFGTSLKNYKMQSFYESNADILINFCFQFKEKASDLISLSSKWVFA